MFGQYKLTENGRSEKIRTSDPHNPIVVRYQAAPRSETSGTFYHSSVIFGMKLDY